VRVLDSTIERFAEALVLTGAVRECARKPPRDCIDENHRRELTPGENVRPDRDRGGAEVIDDARIEAFEAGRQHREHGLADKVLDERLVEMENRGGGGEEGEREEEGQAVSMFAGLLHAVNTL